MPLQVILIFGPPLKLADVLSVLDKGLAFKNAICNLPSYLLIKKYSVLLKLS
jgi:hypothetical protein